VNRNGLRDAPDPRFSAPALWRGLAKDYRCLRNSMQGFFTYSPTLSHQEGGQRGVKREDVP